MFLPTQSTSSSLIDVIKPWSPVSCHFCEHAHITCVYVAIIDLSLKTAPLECFFLLNLSHLLPLCLLPRLAASWAVNQNLTLRDSTSSMSYYYSLLQPCVPRRLRNSLCSRPWCSIKQRATHPAAQIYRSQVIPFCIGRICQQVIPNNNNATEPTWHELSGCCHLIICSSEHDIEAKGPRASQNLQVDWPATPSVGN